MEYKTTQSYRTKQYIFEYIMRNMEHLHTSPGLEAIIWTDTFQECQHIHFGEFEEKEGEELWGRGKSREINKEGERGGWGD